MARIGIYSGSFNPIHIGHITFALQAIELANLDRVYFLPDRLPPNKAVEHYAHRVAMIKQALLPHSKLKVIELNDVSFRIKTTYPKLKKIFRSDQLVFLFGADTASEMIKWPNINILFATTEIIIALRDG